MNKRPERNPRRPPLQHVLPYALTALGAFIAACVVLTIMLTNAALLTRFGLVGNLYYVLLVPLGLAAAAFLFGVLRSYAVYVRKESKGSLELGGPVVAFLAVVVLGFYLAPGPSSFSITVFVHGSGGPQDIVLRNEGSVLVDFGSDRRRERIGDKGEAVFRGIPASFRGQSILASVDAPGYELVSREEPLQLDGDSAYVAVRRVPATFKGYIRGASGEPVARARITIDGNSALTEPSGFFALTMPATHTPLTMQVQADGFETWQGAVVPGGNEIAVSLTKAQ